MIYRAVQPHTKAEAEAIFAQGTREQIIDALLGVTYYVEDWRWVQSACLDWLERADSSLQYTAIQCLGHIATFHHVLDLDIVLPAFQAHLSDPALASVFYDALSDIAGVEDTSYFEQNWAGLPEQLKETLIESGVFNNLGKRVRKRDFRAAQQDATRRPPSRDQELLEQLKQQYDADASHDWKEYYDDQGRLLRLYLDDLGLTQLPAELWQLTSLQELDLGENPLKSLPAEIGTLVNLERLALTENQLTSLPTALWQLVNLQELFLGGNQLSSLPAEVGQLINLQELDLTENRLSSLPAELGQLVNLLSLSLDENQLSSLPAEVGQLVNLRTIWARKNQLRSLPAELGQLVNLKWLSLDDNQLKSLPAELGRLTRLYALHLDRNPQLQIPPSEVVQQGIPTILAYLRTLL